MTEYVIGMRWETHGWRGWPRRSPVRTIQASVTGYCDWYYDWYYVRVPLHLNQLNTNQHQRDPALIPADSSSILDANHLPSKRSLIRCWKALLQLFPAQYQRASGSHAVASARRGRVSCNLQS